MNKKLLWVVLGMIILIGGIAFAVQSYNASTSKTAQLTSTNPQDIAPGLYPNPIKNISTVPGFTIKNGLVENNTDPTTGAVVSDHLELQLTNTTAKAIKDFEVYYTITDTKTKKQEGYYKKLTGFVLQPNATTTVYFDNKPGNDHFTANKSSLYYKSTNALQFAIQVSAPGYQLQTIQLNKAAGGAETKD